MHFSKSLVLSLLGLSLTTINGASFNYSQQGADWTGFCANGTRQSPVDLPTDTDLRNSANGMHFTDSDEIRFIPSYGSISGVEVEDVGYTVKAYTSNGYLSVWDHDSNLNVFEVLQFHFHSPSEHTIDEAHYDLEMHIVHTRTSDSQKSVVAVFFDRTAGNTNSTFLSSLDLEKVNGTSSTVPLADFFKDLDSQAFYQYDGSLTTPTCDEVVTFNILKYPFPISDYQLNIFQNKWSNNTAFANGNGNNRAIQPLNGRAIYFYDGSAVTFSGAVAMIQYTFALMAILALALF